MTYLLTDDGKVPVYRTADGALLGWCNPLLMPGNRLGNLAGHRPLPLRLEDGPLDVEPVFFIARPHLDGYGVGPDFPVEGLEGFVPV